VGGLRIALTAFYFLLITAAFCEGWGAGVFALFYDFCFWNNAGAERA
jgi:hypothetical protein